LWQRNRAASFSSVMVFGSIVPGVTVSRSNGIVRHFKHFGTKGLQIFGPADVRNRPAKSRSTWATSRNNFHSVRYRNEPSAKALFAAENNRRRAEFDARDIWFLPNRSIRFPVRSRCRADRVGDYRRDQVGFWLNNGSVDTALDPGRGRRDPAVGVENQPSAARDQDQAQQGCGENASEGARCGDWHADAAVPGRAPILTALLRSKVPQKITK
jgi:hypothetical protein